VLGSIVEEKDVDAITYFANEELIPDGEVCGEIFKAAGYNELN
jgi:O-acetyl-ADP-ribose deacetylase (regulator of RNase III)